MEHNDTSYLSTGFSLLGDQIHGIPLKDGFQVASALRKWSSHLTGTQRDWQLSPTYRHGVGSDRESHTS